MPTPDNAEAQVRLGEAYLNVGQDEKALTAFDNALKISTKPVVWNNIAYQLARKKAHLDVARRYADSAVTSTAAALRTLPDETAVRLLLRGTLSCNAAATDCTFVLALPEDVKSVD